MYEMATRLFDELTDFEQLVAEAGATGLLRLSSHEPILRYFMPEIVRQFANRFPFCRLKLSSRLFKESVDLVLSNDADIGMVSSVARTNT